MLANGVVQISNPPRALASIRFRVSDSILRDIGGLQSREDDEFNHRNGYLTGATFSRGGLAVIDWTRVRLFDSRGIQTAVVGQKGSGPNEFQGLTQLCRFGGDSLLVMDDNLRRASIISPQGEIVRQFPYAQFGGTGVKILGDGCFADGSFAAQTFSRAAGESIMESYVVHIRADGAVVDSLGRFPQPSFAGVGRYMRLHLRGDFLYVNDPRTSDVRRYDMHGRLRRVVQMRDESRTMSDKDAAMWGGAGAVAAAGSGAPSSRQERPRTLTWPFYRDVLIDSNDRLWVLDFPPEQNAPDRWTAYDSTGAVLGAVIVSRGPPMGTSPLLWPTTFIDADRDQILLLEHDADGAAHFRTRRLIPVER